MIAVEAAKQLMNRGISVAGVVVFDATLPQHKLSDLEIKIEFTQTYCYVSGVDLNDIGNENKTRRRNI